MIWALVAVLDHEAAAAESCLLLFWAELRRAAQSVSNRQNF